MFKKINEKLQDLVNKVVAFFQSDFFKNLLNSTRNFFTAKFELIDQDDRLIDPLKDEIHRPINKANTLYFFIIAVVVSFAIWGSIAKIDRSVMANGQITPNSKIQMITSIITGKLEKIYVEEGSYVKEGDPLFSIDALETIAERDKTENLYYATLAKIGRLKAESGIDKELFFDLEVRENRPDYVEIETQIYNLNKAELEITERQLSMSEDLYSQGAESEMSLLISKQQLLKRKNQILLELSEAEEILSNAKAVLPGHRLRAEQAVIKSPVKGTLTNVNIFTIGQLVESGSLLGEVVPDEEDLIIEARVLPEDSAFVQKDMKAFIAVTSYDQSIYGRMQGKVEKISANTRTDQNTGEIFYTATLSANFKEFSEKVGGRIQPGMVIQASIVGDKRTVLGYIFSPVTKLQSRAFREK
ncbi:MAG: hypothetical protein CMD08_04675 [Flavobacteriales bacterium]|nr:hypothetical protein [Flavobacteriales bacterium]